MKPTTLGELKRQNGEPSRYRSVREEIRHNLTQKLSAKEPLFPGIIGYEDSVIPAIINALLSKHNLIILGLRGQAKSRMLRALTDFLDEEIACVADCEINDDPFFPICGVCSKRIQEEGDDLPITYLSREQRYIEKLATPDVTIADIIGDLDPIKAALFYMPGRQAVILQRALDIIVVHFPAQGAVPEPFGRAVWGFPLIQPLLGIGVGAASVHELSAHIRPMLVHLVRDLFVPLNNLRIGGVHHRDASRRMDQLGSKNDEGYSTLCPLAEVVDFPFARQLFQNEHVGVWEEHDAVP